MTPIILVPIDGSDHARSAIPVARTLATLTGAELRVVHVGDAPPPPRGLPDLIGTLGDAVLVTRAGEPAVAILEEARGADMVVMCAHAGHPRPGPGLGHVAEAALRDATCPVVIVPPSRGEVPWTLRLLLLPQDGSPEAAAAADPAARLATRAGAALVVVHIVGDGETARLRAPAYVDQDQHEWPAWQAEFLARLRCRCERDAPMRLVVAVGDPAVEVPRAAREASADLIVVAWAGTFEGARASTLKGVLAGAVCPVMVVRAK